MINIQTNRYGGNTYIQDLCFTIQLPIKSYTSIKYCQKYQLFLQKTNILPSFLFYMWSEIKNFVLRHRYKFITGCLGIAVLGYLFYEGFGRGQNIKLSAFLQALNRKLVKEVVISDQAIFFRGEADQWFHTVVRGFPMFEIRQLLYNVDISFSEALPAKAMVVGVVGGGMSLATTLFMIDRVKSGPTCDMKPKRYDNSVHFQDFYGGEIIKTKLRETISFLHDPHQFEQFGARIRRGVLLYGPPGTGKTMLARALANEAQCEFIKMAASEFQELFAGVGAKRVRQLFREARQCKDGCIIYIDQIDALGNRLNSLRDSHETTSTITQFLSQMDGFSPLDRVVVVASTNRIDLIDAAVLRAGRFDIKVQISLPCFEERMGILKTLIRKKLKKQSIDDSTLEFVCKKSEGSCGADLEALLNEAVYKAIQEEKQEIQSKHVRQALEDMMSKR